MKTDTQGIGLGEYMSHGDDNCQAAIKSHGGREYNDGSAVMTDTGNTSSSKCPVISSIAGWPNTGRSKPEV